MKRSEFLTSIAALTMFDTLNLKKAWINTTYDKY